jgi:hypothetical protein
MDTNKSGQKPRELSRRMNIERNRDYLRQSAFICGLEAFLGLNSGLGADKVFASIPFAGVRLEFGGTRQTDKTEIPPPLKNET